MSIARHHADWLSLLEINGPFLSLETLVAIFPQGLEREEPELRRRLRLAYEEWQDNQLGLKAEPAIHLAWVRYVLEAVLAMPREVLRSGAEVPESLRVALPEHGETLAPDFAIVDPDGGRPQWLIQVVPAGQRLESDLAGHSWKATPATRMQTLLYAADVPLGLVTNGEQWMLVYAPRNATAGYISWYAALWLEEPITLRAWISLLSAHRFFGVAEPATLAAMLRRSAEDQAQVTDQLGYQVRRAVEMLVRAIDVADRDHGLLQGVSETTLYEAALTVMMRLVFLFYAEERKLFPLDDKLYSEYYAASTLSAELRKTADGLGDAVIERRADAWCRLLATFRAIHGGIQHDRLRLPAYGGSLFDPDRFPFLEGRPAGSTWTGTPAQPLPINNLTVLHLLEALQQLQVKAPGGERQTRRMSFRALDIEQIGHVYEGLLDHTAVRAPGVVLGLAGTKDKEPEIALADLEAKASDEAGLLALLKEETGRSESALRKALAAAPEMHWQGKLLAVCGGDETLLGRVQRYAGLIRTDDLGQPIVILSGSVYVTAGAERRATGTHYTPRSLTEPIVQHTLEPLVYHGPAEGLPKAQWTLRPAGDLIQLKICDMAMGSGAFLVQVCRYLAERVLEAIEKETGDWRLETGYPAAAPRPHHPNTPTPQVPTAFAPILAATDADERTILARRLVAERCIYGVDKNPLAVEMAKLSLWLITLDKGRAFNFLDHALKCGDSLVGIGSLDQLLCWNLAGSGDRHFDTLAVEETIRKVVALRGDIEALPVLDVQDQQVKGYWLADAEGLTAGLRRAGDLLVASYYNTLGKQPQATLREALLSVAKGEAEIDAKWRQHSDLGDLRPFHWPLEFPEVFLAEGRSGFDGFVGNPPFIGGKRIREALGDRYRTVLYELFTDSLGGADLSAFFFLRAYQNLNREGALGLIATNTIAQGDTRLTGLGPIEGNGGTIFRAENSMPWPGQAAVVVSIVFISKAPMRAPFVLDGREVAHISALLDSAKPVGEPYRLASNEDISYIGSFVNGMGFVLSPSEAEDLLSRDPHNKDVVFPYLNGEDLNSHPEQQPSRWVINFFDWPRERTLPGSWFALDEKAQTQVRREGTVPADYPAPVAADYPDCYRIVKERVYPVRQAVNREAHRKYWWHYGDKRPQLYATIAPLKRVLVVALTSRTGAFAFLPTGIVFSHAVGVIAFEAACNFALLQSCWHIEWALTYGSSLKGDLRYTPSDIFVTFPFPRNLTAVEKPGILYDVHRRTAMLSRREGLTSIYNHYHDASDNAIDISQLRCLQVEMDNAVAAAYGWTDLDLGHGFHQTPQGLRYTISKPARREVLRRLLELNHARHAEEVKAGLHEKKAVKKGRGAVNKGQMELL